MATVYTGSVDALILSASRRGNIPDAQMTYLTPDFLAMIDEELMAYAMPVLHARRDDYYLEELMFNLATPDVYIGSESPSMIRHPAWRLPEYAMASTVRDVQGVSPSGTFYNLGRVMADDVPNMIAQGWYFYGNYLVYQCNTVSSTAPPVAIRCIVHVKPNRMVNVDAVMTEYTGEITQLGVVARVISVTSPTNFQVNKTINANFGGDPTGRIDVISGTPGYEVKNRFIEVNPILSTDSVSLPVAPPVPIAIGDWISPPGFSPMIPLPLEMHALLAQRVVVKFLEAQGEASQLEQARNSLEEMAKQIPLLIQPRAEGKPKKLAPRLGLWRRWRW